MTDAMRQALAKRGRVWGQPPNVGDRELLGNEHAIAQAYGFGEHGAVRIATSSGAYRVYAPPAE